MWPNSTTRHTAERDRNIISTMTSNFFCFIGISLAVGAAAGIPAGPAAQQAGGAGTARALEADGTVTGFALPNPGSGPTTIAIAPDGTLWFTEANGNRIGRMAPDGTGIQEFDLPHPGSAPRIITLGSDGNFWFSEHLGNRMGRITPAGVITEFDIPTPDSQPRATALGRDGNVWFGEFAGGKIGRVTPQGVITEFAIPTANSGPRALAAGPDGNIWFSEFNTGKIGRMTSTGQVTEFILPGTNRGPGDITAGADGNMWFVELAGRMDGRTPDGNRIGRITMDGKVSEFPIPSQAGSPINIAVGPDRNVWFTKGALLGMATPEGSVIELSLVAANAGLTGLTAGSDRRPPDRLTNRLWFTESAANKIGYLTFK
jgi:virginiamycin B lyase